MNRILELLAQFNGETTIEQARNIVADISDEATRVNDDITGYNSTISDLNAKIDDMQSTIEMLQEENGRLFRERINRNIKDDIEEKKEEKKNIDEEIAELESYITI